MTKPLILTLGEPAGIGIDLFLQLAPSLPPTIKVAVDKNLLKHRAKQLNIDYQIPDSQIIHFEAAAINCCGKPTSKNAPYILRTLDYAIAGCLAGEFAALVTGPIQKSVINDAGIAFSGHTEYLAKKTGVAKTVMCFENKSLRVALATTHIALRSVPDLISEKLLTEVISIIEVELRQKFNVLKPVIAVCGLNPHAGEAGHFGTEEQTIIIPTLEKLKNHGIAVTGPFPADTVFHQPHADCILSLYHDQLLPALKMHLFYDTVNITLGLPFIRTSVDHGTALELAGTGHANPASLKSAIDAALRLAGNK